MDAESPRCAACGLACGDEEPAALDSLPESLRSALETSPGAAPDAMVCRPCIVKARLRQVTSRLAKERGELTALEHEVAEKVARGAAVARLFEEEFRRDTTRSQRLADDVARVGGSWRFVVAALIAIAVWMALNTWLLRQHAFDPFPYILLNLLLSCLAALQAPIIMMSQNRAAQRDRAQANQDFEVNLKAELEIAALHDKLDHLMQVRWEDLLAVQELQLELLRSLEARVSHLQAARGH
jgi:uncharacterized membrane protein